MAQEIIVLPVVSDAELDVPDLVCGQCDPEVVVVSDPVHDGGGQFGRCVRRGDVFQSLVLVFGALHDVHGVLWYSGFAGIAVRGFLGAYCWL